MFIKHINEYDNILPHVCISPSVSGGRCLDGYKLLYFDFD